jgi:hypothetical protein
MAYTLTEEQAKEKGLAECTAAFGDSPIDQHDRNNFKLGYRAGWLDARIYMNSVALASLDEK